MTVNEKKQNYNEIQKIKLETISIDKWQRFHFYHQEMLVNTDFNRKECFTRKKNY